MSDLMEKIFEKFREKYGNDAKLEDGEMQVFEFQDCTVVLSLNDDELDVKVTADKPIKCDFASGMFKQTESEDIMKKYRIEKYNPKEDRWEDLDGEYSKDDVKTITKGFHNEGLFYYRKGSKIVYIVEEVSKNETD